MILTVFSPKFRRQLKRWGLYLVMILLLTGLSFILGQPLSREVQPPLPPDHWPEKPLRVLAVTECTKNIQLLAQKTEEKPCNLWNKIASCIG